jgi:hypothetical protein
MQRMVFYVSGLTAARHALAREFAEQVARLAVVGSRHLRSPPTGRSPGPARRDRSPRRHNGGVGLACSARVPVTIAVAATATPLPVTARLEPRSPNG